MLHRDPRCVFVADSLIEAELGTSLLSQQGIDAELMNRSTLGGLEGLTPWSSSGVSARGLEIWVKNAADATKARELLEHHEELRAARAAVREKAQGTLLVVCEDCGEHSSFPASAQGSVQHCPHCDSYLDVEPAGSAAEDLEYGSEDEPDEEEEEPGPPPGPDTRIEPA